jgi:hypothetical protein
LIIDPACSIIFEAEKEEKDIMDSHPEMLTNHFLALKR